MSRPDQPRERYVTAREDADATRFPALRHLLDAGVLDSPATTTGEAGFAFGLQRLLDGIDALIDVPG